MPIRVLVLPVPSSWRLSRCHGRLRRSGRRLLHLSACGIAHGVRMRRQFLEQEGGLPTRKRSVGERRLASGVRCWWCGRGHGHGCTTSCRLHPRQCRARRCRSAPTPRRTCRPPGRRRRDPPAFGACNASRASCSWHWQGSKRCQGTKRCARARQEWPHHCGQRKSLCSPQQVRRNCAFATGTAGRCASACGEPMARFGARLLTRLARAQSRDHPGR